VRPRDRPFGSQYQPHPTKHTGFSGFCGYSVG
jgi:hypothetical protein